MIKSLMPAKRAAQMAARLLVAASAACAPWAGARAQQAPEFQLPAGVLKKNADALLGVMSFQVTPDVTTASLSINKADSGNPNLGMSNLGAGFTWSDDLPLYLEGNISGARYDPTFAATNGQETRRVPLKWNSGAVTAGIGWDFRLGENLVLRPVLNATIGIVASDLRLLQFLVNDRLGTDIQWANGQSLKAFGYGGSLILDYELYRPDYEIDAELRYTYITLKSFDTRLPVKGEAVASNLNLWTRWRAPLSDWTAFSNPVRYVLEVTHTEYLGEQRGALGFDNLTSLGVGLEVEPGYLLDRARVVGRYVFSDNVSGFSVGVAVTF